jgi:ketosteroid isomerase-like protein
MKSRYPLMLAALVLVIVGTNLKSVSANQASGAETLKKMEAEFMNAAAAKGSAGYMAYYADNAVELPNGAPAINGKDAIAKTMSFLDQPGNKLTWTPEFAEMSASGDLGYTYGTYEFRSKDKDGKATVEYGKYASIWKKQKDGSWKVALDMGNSLPSPKL